MGGEGPALQVLQRRSDVRVRACWASLVSEMETRRDGGETETETDKDADQQAGNRISHSFTHSYS